MTTRMLRTAALGLATALALTDLTAEDEARIGALVKQAAGYALFVLSRYRANLAHGETGRHATLVFLEATDEVLVRRQEAARRPHPLQG